MGNRKNDLGIQYSIPYRSDKNLGKCYNNFMNLLPSDNSYACFVDADTIFTTPNFGTIIEKVTQENPEVGCFVAMTNRVNCKWQVHSGIDINNNDMEYHRKFGKGLQEIYGTFCEDVTHKQKHEVLSGFLILIRKSVWKKIGGFKEEGMLGIDNDLHYRLQHHDEKLYLMKGIYLYHWYRYPNLKDISHLI